MYRIMRAPKTINLMRRIDKQMGTRKAPNVSAPKNNNPLR
jgi:hypothetical protein